MRRVAVAAALLLACGDNLADPQAARSGRRLKLAWYAYEGGARELERSWYFDAALGERCTRRLWSDGRYYCSPATDEAVFINETCTRALGRTLGGLPPAPLFATTFKLATDPVPLPSRLFRRGERTLGPVATWRKTTTGCIPMDLEDGFEYFELGGEIPVAQLVQLRRTTPRGGALAVIDEVSDDGASVPVAYYLRDEETGCTTVERANAERIECIPADAPTAAYFQDAACSEPALGVPVGTSPPLAVRFDVASSCWHTYRVGSEVAAPPLYEQSGASCVETAPPGGQHFFSMAGEETLPSLARQRVTSAERIRAIMRVADELRTADPLVYDAELATDCHHDVTLRCVPRTEVAVTPASRRAFFADPQCQTALDLAFVPAGACDPPARFGSDGDRYYPLGEPYAGPIYVPSTGDTCSGFAPPAPLVAYTVGAQLDPSRFVQAELQIDP